MKSKWIAILLATALVMSIAACGSMQESRQMAKASKMAGSASTDQAAVESTTKTDETEDTAEAAAVAETSESTISLDEMNSAGAASGSVSADSTVSSDQTVTVAGTPGYAGKLFDASVIHEINVEIADEDWQEILDNPIDKPKEYVTVTIDGETFEDVRFSTKGNSSLFMVAADPDSNRYSFKLNFDSKKNEDQTYHGLDQFVLNNNFEDPSYLREFASAWLLTQEGIPTPLMSFVNLSVNGKLFGFYLAEESEGNGFVQRAFGGKGVLYKPESSVLTKRDSGVIEGVRTAIADGTGEDYLKNLVFKELPPDYDTPGADLKYTGDDPENYTDITDNNVTEMKEDSAGVLIAALKNLSEGNYAETLNRSEIIRFFAAYNFVCNSDGYTSTMLHNYVLHEENGILSIVPWDFNGAMKPYLLVTGGQDASSWNEIINMGIDSPTYQGVALEDRPILGWIYKDKAAYADYEAALKDVISKVESGAFESEMQRIYQLIRPCVAKDPTAFCTVEEFDASFAEVMDFCSLRSESISRQLNGKLDRVTSQQKLSERVNWNH